MKKFKKIFAFLMTVCMLCAVMIPAEAVQIEDGNYDALLLEMGIPAEIMEVIPSADKYNLAKAYLSDPESVQISTSTLEIDVLSEMRMFVNMRDTELLEVGYSQEQINRCRDIIDLYNGLSDEQLFDFGLTADEVEALRMALCPSEDWKVQPYGSSIASSKLTYTQTVTQSTTSTTTTKATVAIYFNWTSPYIWDQFDDKVVVSWGGNLLQSRLSERVSYYKPNMAHTSFGDLVGSGSASYREETINSSGIYEFPQNYADVVWGEYGLAKMGAITFQLSQSGYNGLQTKVLSYYLHQIATVDVGIQVNVSGTGVTTAPIISFGRGYDYSYAESVIRY